MKKLVIFLMLPLILFSCTEFSDSVIESVEKEQNTGAYYVSPEEALEYANWQFKNVYGNKTRSILNKESATIQTLDFGLSTRAGHNGAFYIINYSGGGFAIMSSDKRMDPMYAISDKGSLNISDTTFNKGLKWYFEQILKRDQKDLDNSVIIKPVVPGPDTTAYNEMNEELCLPMLSGFKAKFHQGAPYNKYCYTKTGEKAVVGCAPLAIGTVLACYKIPTEIEGYKFDWNQIYSDESHDGWPQLFERIGRSNYLNADYGTSSTGCNSNTYAPTFIKLGKVNTVLRNFDDDLLANILRGFKITVVRGYNPNLKEGHVWLIDGGYIDKSGPVVIDPNAPQKYMFHCVWGWGGSNNGYYLYKKSTDYIGSGNYSYTGLQMLTGY